MLNFVFQKALVPTSNTTIFKRLLCTENLVLNTEFKTF